MTLTKNNVIICDECGLFCRYFDEYTPFGCSSYDPLEPLEPSYICEKCFPATKKRWIKKFTEGFRYGNWQKSKAEQEAAKECGLRWVNSDGIGTLGTEDFCDPYKYITKEEYERLEKMPYYGYCYKCGARNKGGYCSDETCEKSFSVKQGN